MNELSLDEAYGYVDKVVAAYQGTREDHIILSKSLALIRKALEEHQNSKTAQVPFQTSDL